MNRRAFLSRGIAAGLAASTPMRLTWAKSSQPLRLNSNENPRGLSPRCREAVLKAIPEAGRYPFSHLGALRDAIAARHRLESENVVLGNGSSEVIQMAVQALAQPGGRLVLASPTFDIVQGYVREGVESIQVPLREDHAHDLDGMREAAEASSSALVYLCNPNNPTATLTPSARLDEWLREAPPETAFLIDEAYFDYVRDEGYRSATPWVKERPNLVVTRTFSKVYGMAGLRLGYGLCHAATAEKLRRWAADVNINHLAIVAGLEALKDDPYRRSSVDLNLQSRNILTGALDRMEIPHLPSHTNFLMYRINQELGGYIQRMREHGALVGRAFPPLLRFNRVTLGLPQEMRRFVEILEDFRGRGWI